MCMRIDSLISHFYTCGIIKFDFFFANFVMVMVQLVTLSQIKSLSFKRKVFVNFNGFITVLNTFVANKWACSGKMGLQFFAC